MYARSDKIRLREVRGKIHTARESKEWHTLGARILNGTFSLVWVWSKYFIEQAMMEKRDGVCNKIEIEVWICINSIGNNEQIDRERERERDCVCACE